MCEMLRMGNVKILLHVPRTHTLPNRQHLKQLSVKAWLSMATLICIQADWFGVENRELEILE